MSFIFTIIGAIIMQISIIVGCVLLIRLLMNLSAILPFRSGYDSTYATLVGFYEDSSQGYPSTFDPIISYYNPYKAETIEKKILHSKIIPRNDNVHRNKSLAVVDIGEKILVDYTKNVVRISDSRFVSDKKYALSRYLIPVIICAIVAVFGFVTLIMGIVLNIFR